MAATRRIFLRNDVCRCFGGAVAQLGERLVRNEEVRGSTPLGSTTRLSRSSLFSFRGAISNPIHQLTVVPAKRGPTYPSLVVSCPRFAGTTVT